jgi:hypothetical protein
VITLDVRSNLKGIIRQLNSFERQFVPIATAKALTFTAETVRDAEQWKMTRVFDRPTKYTIDSMWIKWATVKDPVAAVYFRDFAPKGTPAGKYLYHNIHGGTREIKASERKLAPFMAGHRFLMPGAAIALDGHGNIPRGEMTRILSQVKALGNGQNQSIASKKRNRKKTGPQYFWPKPGSGLKPGIYKREGRNIKPALVFVSRAHYRPRFPFYEFGIAVARAKFPDHFDRQLAREMQKAFTPVPMAA